MKRAKEQYTYQEKLAKGLDLAYKKLIEFKKAKKSPLVIMQNGKIIKVMPDKLK